KRAAATAKCTNRSVRRDSLSSIQSVGWKSRTSPARRTGRSDGSNRSIGPMPLRPVFSPSQKASTPTPTGVTGPIPVMTTLEDAELDRDTELRGHEVDGLAHRLHALHLLLGDLDPHLVLQGQHGLGEVERVCVEVLREPRLHGHLRFIHGELFREHLTDLV